MTQLTTALIARQGRILNLRQRRIFGRPAPFVAFWTASESGQPSPWVQINRIPAATRIDQVHVPSITFAAMPKPEMQLATMTAQAYRQGYWRSWDVFDRNRGMESEGALLGRTDAGEVNTLDQRVAKAASSFARRSGVTSGVMPNHLVQAAGP